MADDNEHMTFCEEFWILVLTGMKADLPAGPDPDHAASALAVLIRDVRDEKVAKVAARTVALGVRVWHMLIAAKGRNALRCMPEPRRRRLTISAVRSAMTWL